MLLILDNMVTIKMFPCYVCGAFRVMLFLFLVFYLPCSFNLNQELSTGICDQ